MMKRKGLGFVSMVVAAAALAMPSIARADFTTHPLVGAAGSLLSGSGMFFATGLNSSSVLKTLDVQIDYAVWGPGAYTGGFNTFGTNLPISVPATNYTYAYQIYNRDVAHGGLSDTTFSQLGVSVLGPITALGQDRNFDSSAFDVAGTFSVAAAGGAAYFFLTPRINPGQFSAVVLLSSAYAPVFSNATTFDSGLNADGFLPTPVPAPGAAFLGMLGLGLVRWFRRIA